MSIKFSRKRFGVYYLTDTETGAKISLRRFRDGAIRLTDSTGRHLICDRGGALYDLTLTKYADTHREYVLAGEEDRLFFQRCLAVMRFVNFDEWWSR